MQRLVFRVVQTGSQALMLHLVKSSYPDSDASSLTPFKCNLDDPAFAKMRASNSPPNATRDAGRLLFDPIATHPAIGRQLGVVLAAPMQERHPIYVETAPEVDALPWEALCTPDGTFLALDERWAIGRIVSSPATSPLSWQLAPPLRIAAILSALGVTAAEEWRALQKTIRSRPSIQVEVLVLVSEKELHSEITEAVAAGRAPGVRIEYVPPDRPALRAIVSNFRPHVLHFFCHGSTAVGIPHLQVAVRSDWEVGASDSSLLLMPQDILELSGSAHDRPWLVVLNCSETAAASDPPFSLTRDLVGMGVPAAIGLRDSVTAEDATLFTGDFYDRFLADLASRVVGAAQDNSIDLAQLVVGARLGLAKKYKVGATLTEAAASSTEWTVPMVCVRPEPIYVELVPAHLAPADTGDVLEGAPAGAEAEATPTPDKSATGPVRAGSVANYSADTFDRTILVEGDTDTLGIRSDVDVLSSVIASQNIQPPLSLGIFGDWGAGKSFLLNQLRLRVAQLASRARSVREEDEAGSYYCGDIVQIEFNAWQYAGGDLWASLINRVFEGIRDHLGSDEQYRKVIDEIERQDETVRNAARRLADAEQEVRAAVSPAAHRTVAQVEADNPELAQAANSFTKNLGLDKNKVDLIDVAVRTRELHTLAGRLREGWSRQGGRGRTVVVSALAIGVVLLGTATALPPVANALAALVGVLAPVLTVGTSILKPTGDALRAGLRILDAGDREKQQYAESKAAYDEAREQLERLRRQGPGGLYGFVEDRYQTKDYRKALGMVSLIREDLRRLTTFTTRQPGVPGIERVVLYIDDLDRCPSEQVVRVLEAVNLLFGFPLFVVVIAVDSRWLIRALEENFQGVFSAGPTPAPTPQNYLEKVIQIPFWLEPMGEAGFGRLVSTLARPLAPKRRADAPQSTPTPVGAPSQHESVGPTSPATVATTPIERVEADTRGATRSPSPDGGDGTDGPDGTSTTVSPEPDARGSTISGASEIDPRPETLEITDSELQFLRKLAPLVDTPRAAKRLLNTYQLVRVSVEDVPQFLKRSNYEPLLVLLALVTSSPGLTASMVQSMLGSKEPNLPSFLLTLDKLDATDDVGIRGWMRLRSYLSRCPNDSVTAEAIREWLPVVSRFSFQPGLAQLSKPDASSSR